MNTSETILPSRERVLIAELAASLRDVTPSASGVGVFFDGSHQPEQSRTVTPVYMHQVYQQENYPELYDFENDNIRKRRIAAGHTTMRFATDKLHHILQPSVMNPHHGVMAHAHELPGNQRVVIQAAFDTRISNPETVDDRALASRFHAMRNRLASTANLLYELSAGDSQLEKLGQIEHAPTVPNAVSYQFDITNSRGLSDYQRRYFLSALDEFEQQSLNDKIERIQESGDSRIYTHLLSAHEVRHHQASPATQKIVIPFAQKMHEWYRSQPIIDATQHPLRGVVYPGWLDKIGDTYTSTSFWGANEILSAESRNASSLQVLSTIPEPRKMVA